MQSLYIGYVNAETLTLFDWLNKCRRMRVFECHKCGVRAGDVDFGGVE